MLLCLGLHLATTDGSLGLSFRLSAPYHVAVCKGVDISASLWVWPSLKNFPHRCPMSALLDPGDVGHVPSSSWPPNRNRESALGFCGRIHISPLARSCIHRGRQVHDVSAPVAALNGARHLGPGFQCLLLGLSQRCQATRIYALQSQSCWVGDVFWRRLWAMPLCGCYCSGLCCCSWQASELHSLHKTALLSVRLGRARPCAACCRAFWDRG